MNLKKQVQIHFIYENKIIAKKTEFYIPRVGDEIRLRSKIFYKVKKVVWTYDEDDCSYSRVNIGVVKI